MKKRLLATVLAGAMVLSMAACGNSNANKTESAAASETANASTEAGAESGETQAAAQDGDASSELNIYMWQQYISDDLIKNFETENNCKVNLSYMSDNADAINKLTALQRLIFFPGDEGCHLAVFVTQYAFAFQTLQHGVGGGFFPVQLLGT